MAASSYMPPSKYGCFTDPVNNSGLVSKTTKQVARQVDSNLLAANDDFKDIFDEERENMHDLPQMSVDEWNQVYIEVHDELYAEIAKQLIAERNQDPVKAYDLNEAFSNMAIEQAAEMFDMENPNPDVAVCALCQQSAARRLKGQEIHCEMTDCIHINMKCSDWTVE